MDLLNTDRKCEYCGTPLSPDVDRRRRYCPPKPDEEQSECAWAGRKVKVYDNVVRFEDNLDPVTRTSRNRAYKAKGEFGLSRRKLLAASLGAVSAASISYPHRTRFNKRTDHYTDLWAAGQRFRYQLSLGPDPTLKSTIRAMQTQLDSLRLIDPEAERLWYLYEGLLCDAGEEAALIEVFDMLDWRVAQVERYWAAQRGESVRLAQAVLRRVHLHQLALEDGLKIPILPVLERAEWASNLIQGLYHKRDNGIFELLLNQHGLLTSRLLIRAGGSAEATGKAVLSMRMCARSLGEDRVWAITLKQEALYNLKRVDNHNHDWEYLATAEDRLSEIAEQYTSAPVSARTLLSTLQLETELLFKKGEEQRAREKLTEYAGLCWRYPYSHHIHQLRQFKPYGKPIPLPKQTVSYRSYSSPLLPYFYWLEKFPEP